MKNIIQENYKITHIQNQVTKYTSIKTLKAVNLAYKTEIIQENHTNEQNIIMINKSQLSYKHLTLQLKHPTKQAVVQTIIHTYKNEKHTYKVAS